MGSNSQTFPLEPKARRWQMDKGTTAESLLQFVLLPNLWNQNKTGPAKAFKLNHRFLDTDIGNAYMFRGSRQRKSQGRRVQLP